MATTLDIADATAGQTTLSGTVDGVDLAQLELDVEDHDHITGGSVNNATETLTIADVNGNAVAVLTAADQYGYNAQNEQGYGGSGSRTHNPTVNDTPGTLVTDVTQAPTGLSPKTDGDIVLGFQDGNQAGAVNGDILCDLIDGMAPEVLWDEYDDHYHSTLGYADYETLPAVQAYGNSGNSWFWVSRSSGGSSPYWAQLHALGGAHNHTEGPLVSSGDDRGSGAGSDDAGDTNKVVVDHATGNISLKGDVNGIGIAQFKTAFDAHTHASGAGSSGAKYLPAILRDVADDFAIWALKDGVTWLRIYIDPGTHSHGGSGLTFGAPV